MEEYCAYVGLDVHKETIAVAVAYPGRSKPESLGVIANRKKSILNLVHRLPPDGEAAGFCYGCNKSVGARERRETGRPLRATSPGLFASGARRFQSRDRAT